MPLSMHMKTSGLVEIGRGAEASIWRDKDYALRIPHHNTVHYHPAIYTLKKHPNVVQILDIDSTYSTIKMEYIPGKSLTSTLNECQVCAALAVQFTCQILHGVSHLHNNGIVHCDLSCNNIIIFDGRLKIIDFYSAQPVRGSPIYMAPEVVKFGRFGKQGDVWSIAVIMLMLEGLCPWHDFELAHLLYHLALNPEAINGPPEVDEADIFRDILRIVFRTEDTRPSLVHLLRSVQDLASIHGVQGSI